MSIAPRSPMSESLATIPWDGGRSKEVYGRGRSAPGFTRAAVEAASPACPSVARRRRRRQSPRSEEHTSELQSRLHLVCRLLLEKKKNKNDAHPRPPHPPSHAPPPPRSSPAST